MFDAFAPEEGRKGKGGLRTGLPVLDDVIGTGDGITTLRSLSARWLFGLAANIIVRNHSPSRKTLYLHWVDYHKRFWTVNFDMIPDLARRNGADLDSILDGTYFIRMFSRDNVETEENWRSIMKFGPGLNFVVLDSVSELYETENGLTRKSKRPDMKSMVYAIGMFSRLCMMNGCPGIALDISRRPVHPFLANLSSVIIEFDLPPEDEGGGVRARVVKHHSMPESVIWIRRDRRPDLRRWLG